jgi:Mycobacterium membrane protein
MADRLKGVKTALIRRKKIILQAVAVLTVFTVALLIWAGNLNSGGSLPNVASSKGALPGDGSSLGSDSSAPFNTKAPDPNASKLPGFNISISKDINLSPPGPHTVTITVTSDATMTSVKYATRSADKSAHTEKSVAPPMSITVHTNEGGILAAVGAQAGPNATTISCSVSIDGVIRMQHTAKGPFATVICYG